MESVLAVIGLFVLRMGVPIVVMVLLSWGVSVYVQREEARALEAEKRAALAQAAAAAAPSACWDVKGCSDEAKADCPAVKRPDLPCWLAKQLATGRLSPTCEACAMYQKSLAAARA
ncbi:MAG: hypothetical protein QHH80_13920 [Anaerolineae bacterium]|nr:hypothetical protein [Anaerolineae bacterium]